LAEALQSAHCQLTTLGLRYNQIGDAEAQALAEAMFTRQYNGYDKIDLIIGHGAQEIYRNKLELLKRSFCQVSDEVLGLFQLGQRPHEKGQARPFDLNILSLVGSFLNPFQNIKALSRNILISAESRRREDKVEATVRTQDWRNRIQASILDPENLRKVIAGLLKQPTHHINAVISARPNAHNFFIGITKAYPSLLSIFLKPGESLQESYGIKLVTAEWLKENSPLKQAALRDPAIMQELINAIRHLPLKAKEDIALTVWNNHDTKESIPSKLLNSVGPNLIIDLLYYSFSNDKEERTRLCLDFILREKSHAPDAALGKLCELFTIYFTLKDLSTEYQSSTIEVHREKQEVCLIIMVKLKGIISAWAENKSDLETISRDLSSYVRKVKLNPFLWLLSSLKPSRLGVCIIKAEKALNSAGLSSFAVVSIFALDPPGGQVVPGGKELSGNSSSSGGGSKLGSF
jgi:hypothetical protein